MGGDRLNLVQGNFKDFGALAAQGPAPQPAAVVVVVDAYDLIHGISRSQGHTGPLVEFWGWSRTGKGSHAAGMVNAMADWDGGLGEGEDRNRSINPGDRRTLKEFGLIPMDPWSGYAHRPCCLGGGRLSPTLSLKNLFQLDGATLTPGVAGRHGCWDLQT